MSRRGPEGKVQDAVIRYARERYDALCVKQEPGRYGNGGFLDFVIFPRGLPAFVIEFKAPGGKLTPKQAHNVAQLRSRDHAVHVVDDIEAGKKVIDERCVP